MIKNLNGNFGFINKPKFTIASNTYMPRGLFEKVWFSNNLFTIGNNKPNTNGGGISFFEEEAEISALGEYIERYSSSFQITNGLIYNSFDKLSLEQDCFSPKKIRYFSTNQYLDEKFKLKKLKIDSNTYWIKCKNYLEDKNILLPFFMTNVENIKDDGMHHINTTTGTATHTTIDKAIESGLLECIERDAFSKFWYFQKQKKYKKHSQILIQNTFPNDETINKLFNTKKIKIVSFDIGENSFSPTFVVIIYFKKKNKIYQSIGSASRLNQKDALIKACIEAYQGIEYIELVCEENSKTINSEEVLKFNFSGITSFRKHYALYNLFPSLREQVPVLKDAESDDNFCEEFVSNHKHHINSFNKNELIAKGLDEIYYTNLTTIDVKQLGFEVVKVITPKLNLLTGNFNYPYLGLFDNKKDLFTEFPHPFP
jgi:ribosomal protein S12 methylthiotransferase accessory factor